MDECERVKRTDSLFVRPEDSYLLHVALSRVLLHHCVLFVCEDLAALLLNLLLHELLLLLCFARIALFDKLGELVGLLRVEELLVQADALLPVRVDKLVELLLLLLFLFQFFLELVKLLLASIQRIDNAAMACCIDHLLGRNEGICECLRGQAVRGAS